ncbi:MAG TPA: energy transducer TonB [Betaproteobacteria bacterium]|nr:energy transducer TonB [Betaproteobacteria bacterium]
MRFALPLSGSLPRLDSTDRLWLMILASFCLHLLVLFGIGIAPSKPDTLNNFASPLDVVLVNSKTREKPRHADAYAQANLDGGGDTDAKRRARSPLPAHRSSRGGKIARAQQQRVAALERRSRELLSRIQARTQAVARPPSPEQRRLDAAALVQRSLMEARLAAQIDQEWSAYQHRPRTRFIGAHTREYALALYTDSWRQKVERVGNLNYPEAAKRQRLYGALQLTVYIRADGSVAKIELNRSSGHPILDKAARNIVRLAAPFPPFPPQIRRRYDILAITRTWSFTHEDQLAGSE